MIEEEITEIISDIKKRNPDMPMEEVVAMAHKRFDLNKREHVEHDWMEAEKKGQAVPMDARSSPFVEKRNGVEYRVGDPICMKDGMAVDVPAVPVDPRRREAHKRWKLSNVLEEGECDEG